MKPKNDSLKGRWKIVWMELWDQEYVDMEVPGHITFEGDGNGDFQFGLVRGGFHWTPGDSYIDCTWRGCDEMDEAYGDIYAAIEEGELRGGIEFFNGDESEFRAVREAKKGKSKVGA